MEKQNRTFAGHPDGVELALAGAVTDLDLQQTRGGRVWATAVLTLPWVGGAEEHVPVTFLPSVYDTCADLLTVGELLYVTGRVDVFPERRVLAAATAVQARHWSQILPVEALDLNLHDRHDIIAPLNELGERCWWPWDPQQLAGAALGMYHCRYCGAMVVAGVPHLSYDDEPPGPSEPAGSSTSPAAQQKEH